MNITISKNIIVPTLYVLQVIVMNHYHARKERRVNKIDRYDAEKLLKARKIIMEVYNYNYLSEWDGLSRKLETIISKIDALLNKELKSGLQEEYLKTGKI